MLGQTLEGENLQHHVEELALDPAVRSLHWQEKPDPARLKDFTVTVIGAGMGGLNAALQLREAGFPFTVVEKNTGVGGTWWENRYPGARVDTPSRSYTHLFGVDFPYPNPFCEWRENVKYFDWVADHFDLRRHIQFETEVKALTWDEAAGEWQIDIEGPDGARTIRSRAVITSVGFLSRPNIPNIAGAETFAGASWHTARWPQDVDLKGKRVAVIGTGCTGYQMVPEIALEAAHVTVFQRTAQWLFPVPGYRSPFPPQVNWLDRNLPFHTNFMRARTCSLDRIANVAEIDPDFKDPYAVNPLSKRAREGCVAFLERKLGDPALVAAMTPPHPIWSARAVVVDPDYCVLDALLRDNVTLVTAGIERIEPRGIVAMDGTLHEADVIVYATGFHATEYLYPMTITGRGGQTLEDLWAKDGARAYLGCMMPGFPNLWYDLRPEHQRRPSRGFVPREDRPIRAAVHGDAGPGQRRRDGGPAGGVLALQPPGGRTQPPEGVERPARPQLLLDRTRPLGHDEPVLHRRDVGFSAQTRPRRPGDRLMDGGGVNLDEQQISH